MYFDLTASLGGGLLFANKQGNRCMHHVHNYWLARICIDFEISCPDVDSLRPLQLVRRVPKKALPYLCKCNAAHMLITNLVWHLVSCGEFVRRFAWCGFQC